MKLLKSIEQATQTFFSWMQVQLKYSKDMKKLGYPIQFLNVTQAPYDVVSEFFRGMKGIMLDMYRQPEELKALLDIMVESSIESVAALAQMFYTMSGARTCAKALLFGMPRHMTMSLSHRTAPVSLILR